MANTNKKTDYTDMLLNGIVTDSSLFYKNDPHILSLKRLVDMSGVDHQKLAALSNLCVDTIKRISTLKETDNGLPYDPRLSTYTKVLNGLQLYSVVMKHPTVKKKTTLKSI